MLGGGLLWNSKQALQGVEKRRKNRLKRILEENGKMPLAAKKSWSLKLQKDWEKVRKQTNMSIDDGRYAKQVAV